MGIKRDWLCKAHGVFESSEESPDCPFGCNVVEKTFIQPPGFRSARTSSIDATFDSLAKSHKLTDLGPRSVSAKQQKLARDNAKFNEWVREKYGSTGWGAVPAGGQLNVQTGNVEGSGAGAMGALQSHGAQPDNVLAEVKDALVKPAVIYKRDHENLSVADARLPA